MKNYTGITWSNLELEGLLEDRKDSCVTFKKVNKHFELYPFQLANLTSALDHILKPKLNTYDPELGGLLLAYKNPKVLTPVGLILYDNFYIHIDVEADFYIFKPKVGQSLKGFVNKLGTNHIGILVHKAFNVSIPRPRTEEDWPGDKVKIGQEVRFYLEVINFNNKLPYFRGFLKDEEYLEGCKQYDEEVAAAFKLEFPEDSNFEDPAPPKNKKIVFGSDSEPESSNLVNGTPKKKRKREEDEEEEEEEEDRKSIIQKLSQNSGNLDDGFVTHRKKKSRKDPTQNGDDPDYSKRKQLYVENDDMCSIRDVNETQTDLELSNNNGEEESSQSPKKKKKKKKNHENSDACNDTEDERVYKKTVIRDLIIASDKKSRKRKVILLSDEDESVMDTEDEKNYKSSLKPLIQHVENNEENDFVFEKPKKKKKKKRAEPEVEIDPTVEVKEEPESESEEKRKSRKKKKSREKDGGEEESSQEKYESDMEDRKKEKALLKEKLKIKSEDGEVRKKVKKEKNKERSFQYEH